MLWPVDVFETFADRNIDDAAQIWAEATAARDGDIEVPGLQLSRPVIEQVLNRSPRSRLLIARSRDGVAMGFAATEPHLGDDESVAQLRYLGVRPSAWGQRVGETLLRELEVVLRASGLRAPCCRSTQTTRGRLRCTYGWAGRPPGSRNPIPEPASPSSGTSCVWS
jgi:ribosomal protein S18 acetylase RimI-like enzyme